jgi:hypothetical protein
MFRGRLAVSEPSTTVLGAAWERYRVSGDASEILQLLRTNPELNETCGHPFPSFHRVGDYLIGGHYFRLLRCARCCERLFLRPLAAEKAALDTPGIPYALTGDKLLGWVEEEIERQREKERQMWQQVLEEEGVPPDTPMPESLWPIG